MKYTVLMLMLGMSATVMAEPDATTKREIANLMDHLASSGCQFNRNGSWYSAARAVRHLNRKYDYLLKRDLVPNAEAFVLNAASESSSSGRPYLVRCGNNPEMQSKVWFSEALRKIREGSK